MVPIPTLPVLNMFKLFACLPLLAPIDDVDPSALQIEMQPKVVTKKVEEPPARIGGGKVDSIEDLVDKLKNVSGVI